MEIVEIQEKEDERCPECGGEFIEVEVPRVPLKNKPLSPDKENFIKLQCSLCSYYTMKETPMDKAIRVGVLDDAETPIDPSDFIEDEDE